MIIDHKSNTTLSLTGGPIEMEDTTGTLTIDDTDSANAITVNAITVNAASGGGAFTVDAGSAAEIDGLTLGGSVTVGGTLTLNGDINPTTNNFSVEVLNEGTLNLPTSTDLASLTIDAGGFAKQTSTDTTFGSEVLAVGSLAISDPNGSTNGGVLDLGNGDLIVRDTNASNIEPLLAAGYDEGAWDGEAISGVGPNPAAIISSAAANDYDQIETLGLAQMGAGAGSLNYTSYDGDTVSPGDVLVALTYYGDTNLDRQVNSEDYAMMAPNACGDSPETLSSASVGWTTGDFNYDGVVNEGDYALIDCVAAELNGDDNPGKITSDKTKDTIVVVKGKDGAATSDTAKLTIPSTAVKKPKLEVININPDVDSSNFTVNLTSNSDGTWSVSVTVSSKCPPGDYDISIVDAANRGEVRGIIITATVKAK